MAMTPLDSPPDGAGPFTDERYPARPYPGARPGFSHAHIDAKLAPLRPDPDAATWRLVDTDEDIDTWLAARGRAPLAERVPVLAYGSNACPAKMTWLRDHLGLSGPVVSLLVTCTGLAAVWAYGRRAHDGQRPATLMAMPGAVERHALWLADPDQVRALDVCEGRGERYHLVRLNHGRVRTEDGTVWDRPMAYTGAAEIRRPLLVDGAPVRCAEFEQSRAAGLSGRAAGTDGLAVSLVDGSPVAEDHPGRLFVYGTLRPGDRAWRLIEPMVGPGRRRAHVRGTLYDTGRGYPALSPAGDGEVSGWLLDLRTPSTTLATVDLYEGGEYRRVRTRTSTGAACWTYVWRAGTHGLRRHDGPWAR